MKAQAQTITLRRQDGTEVKASMISRGPAGRRTQSGGLFEPVVGPTGDVIRARVNTTLANPGLKFVVQAHGKLILTEHAERLGYMFYRDLCLQGIPAKGVEASPVHWQIYQKLCELKDANRVPRTPLTAEDMYHPEVVRRRREDHSGVSRIDDDDMAAILQGVRDRFDPETPEIREAARAAGLAVPEPDSGEALSEMIARAKKK